MIHIRNKTALSFVGILCAGALAPPAHGASFDCAKASTKVEHIICDNPEISKLDDALGRGYKAALGDKSHANAIRQEQKQWVEKRNACDDIACVKNIYSDRLSALRASSSVGTPLQKTVVAKYSMINGQGHAICQQLLERLNEETKLNKAVCGLDLLKSIPGVDLPEWKKLSLKDNKMLYMRFLLANDVLEKNYQQAFGQNASIQGQPVDDISIPPNNLLLFGQQVTKEQLEQGWKDAVNNNYDLYRLDGVIAPPYDKDVLIVESGVDVNQGGCPKFRVVRFSPDLRVPKPLKSPNMAWLVGPDAIPFRYERKLYRLQDEEGLDMEQQEQVRTVPHRTVTVGTEGDDALCMIQTNITHY